MPTLKLTCNKCGESLHVPEATRFLTCTACSSQLEVHHSSSTAYTKVLETTETVKLELELEKLDREWMQERKRHVRKTDSSVPARLRFVLALLFLTVGSVVCIGIAVGAFLAGDTFASLLCTGSGMLFAGQAITVGCRLSAHKRAERNYRTRRQQLLHRIESSKDGGGKT